MLKAIKTNHNYKDIPVTMVTVELQRDERLKAINMGARNYLVIPFSQESLIGKILECFEMNL